MAWEADSVIPYVVLPPLLSMLNSVFIEYRPIVKAIEMTMTPVLAMTGVVIWLRPEKAVAGREITQQVLVEGSFSRPLGLTPPIQCGTDNCTNTTLQGHYEEANESFKCRWVCTLCGSRTRWTYIKKGSHISRGAFPGTWWHPGPLKRLDVQWTPAPVNQSKAGKQEVDDASAHNRKRTLETLHEDDRPTHKGNSRGKRNHRGGKVKMG